jgi:hypothetical protein
VVEGRIGVCEEEVVGVRLFGKTSTLCICKCAEYEQLKL